MLVLSRKAGEAIHIGPDIEVHVAGISGDKVRLAVTAPRAVEVHRREIFTRIHGGEERAEDR